MATMKVRVDNPYKNELEEPMGLGEGVYRHTFQYAERLDIQHDGQHFYMYWDEERNALKILESTNNGTLCVFPSTANGILVKSVKQ